MKLFSKRITASLTAILLTLTSLWAFTGTYISAETIPDDPNDEMPHLIFSTMLPAGPYFWARITMSRKSLLQ